MIDFYSSIFPKLCMVLSRDTVYSSDIHPFVGGILFLRPITILTALDILSVSPLYRPTDNPWETFECLLLESDGMAIHNPHFKLVAGRKGHAIGYEPSYEWIALASGTLPSLEKTACGTGSDTGTLLEFLQTLGKNIRSAFCVSPCWAARRFDYDQYHLGLSISFTQAEIEAIVVKVSRSAIDRTSSRLTCSVQLPAKISAYPEIMLNRLDIHVNGDMTPGFLKAAMQRIRDIYEDHVDFLNELFPDLSGGFNLITMDSEEAERSWRASGSHWRDKPRSAQLWVKDDADISYDFTVDEI